MKYKQIATLINMAKVEKGEVEYFVGTFSSDSNHDMYVRSTCTVLRTVLAGTCAVCR